MSQELRIETLCQAGSVSPGLAETLVDEVARCGFGLASPQDGLIRGVDASGAGSLVFTDGGSAVDWLGAQGGSITLWAGANTSIDVSTHRVEGVLPMEMDHLQDTPRFDVVRITGRMRDFESRSLPMGKLWQFAPRLCGLLGGQYAISANEDMMESQLARWCLHDAVASSALPPVAGLQLTVPRDSAEMVEGLENAAAIPGCDLSTDDGTVSLVASGHPVSMPAGRWSELLSWASALSFRCGQAHPR